MVINPVIEIGRRHVGPAVSAGRPKPSIVNISHANARQHEALLEARHRANAATETLKSAADALSVANAEHERLRKRIRELETELVKANACIRDLEGTITRMNAQIANANTPSTEDQSTGKRGRRRKNKDALPLSAESAQPTEPAGEAV